MKMIHSDLKPDNIMVTGLRLKLCDFGSVVMFADLEQHKTEFLVSPYYRPPEVILGVVPLDGAVDMWAAAVTLFEMYSGEFMFPATTNNQLLYLMMKAKGRLPSRLSKKGLFSSQHFCEKTG
jgi:serine/threonine-protein kinase PRP4